MDSITIHCDASEVVAELKVATELLLGLPELLLRLPKGLQGDINLSSLFEQTGCVDLDVTRTGRADELRAVFKPSNRLSNFVRALRAFQGDGLVVEHGGGGLVVKSGEAPNDLKLRDSGGLA